MHTTAHKHLALLSHHNKWGVCRVTHGATHAAGGQALCLLIWLEQVAVCAQLEQGS